MGLEDGIDMVGSSDGGAVGALVGKLVVGEMVGELMEGELDGIDVVGGKVPQKIEMMPKMAFFGKRVAHIFILKIFH